MLLPLILFCLVIPILSSREPVPSCLGPKFGVTSQIPILLQEYQTYSLDELFVGYNLEYSSANLPIFAFLTLKKSQIDSILQKINGLQHFHLDFFQKDNIIALIALSSDNDGISVSWGLSLSKNSAPKLDSRVIVDDSTVDCFDAVWLQDQKLIIVDCVKQGTFLSTNYYYYIDAIKKQVIGRVKNQAFSQFSGKIERKLGLVKKNGMNLLVRTFIAKQINDKTQQNTYAELISLNNPLKPFTVSILDRSKLLQEKLSITDMKIYQNSIYLLDYHSGLIQLGITETNKFTVGGIYRIGTGFYNFGINLDKLGSKVLLAFADRNKIIQVDWSNRLKPQILNKYTIPENSDISELWLNERNIVVQLTAQYTNQRQQTKTRQSTYVFSRGSRVYTLASAVFAHSVKSFSILYPSSNMILFIDEASIKIIQINTPLLSISPIDPSMIGKTVQFNVIAVSKDEFNPDFFIKCNNFFEFIIASEEQSRNYLSKTGQTFPEYFNINYPGQLYIPLGKYFRGCNITYGLRIEQNNIEQQSSYFLKQNSTTIAWKNYQPTLFSYHYLKTQFSSETDSKYISLYTQDINNLTVFSKCQIIRLTEKITCFSNIKISQINFRISNLVVSSFKFTESQSLKIAAIIYQEISNQIFFYNAEDGDDIRVPPITLPQGYQGLISYIEFLNQYLVVVLHYSKSVILYDMNFCLDKLPNQCKQTYIIDDFFFDKEINYFSPISVSKTGKFPSALFIQCLDRVIVMDISTKGIYLLAQIILAQFKNSWQMVIASTSLIVVYPPTTIQQYDLSHLYTAEYIVMTRKYPYYDFVIPDKFSLKSSTSGTTVYLTAVDTMRQIQNSLVILIFRVGLPSLSVFYDVYDLQSSLQESILIDVLGNPLIGDYVTFTKGSILNIFRQYQNPRLVFQNIVNDFKFNLTVSNDPLNRFSYLLQSSIHSTSYPQYIVINNKDISKSGFFDISLDVGQLIDYTNYKDENWFLGSVLNYTIQGCDGCKQKVKIRNHIQLENVQEAIRGMYDYTSGENGGYIQAYKSLIKVLNNGSISQFSSFSTQSPGDVCTSIAYNEAQQFTVSACENGKNIVLFITIQTAFKPFVMGPLQTSASQATKIQSLNNIIILVDTDSSIGSFVSEGSIFIYSLSGNLYNGQTLNQLEIIDSDDLNSAMQWQGGPCYIGNANLTYLTNTETYRLLISQLRSGIFVVDFRVSEGADSVQILKVSFINLQQQLKRIIMTLPNEAYFTAIATIKQSYDVVSKVQQVDIIITTNNYHSFLLNLHMDKAGTVLSYEITRIFYRYGVYQTQNYIKTFNSYFAIVQKSPLYIESDKNSKVVLSVYDTLLPENSSENQFFQVQGDYENAGKIPISYVKGGYVMKEGDIFFDWDRTSKQENTTNSKLFVINRIDLNIYELSVNDELQVSVQWSIQNNQKGYIVAQNDYDSQKFSFTITKNYGKSQDVPFEYNHQRVAFSPDYSQVYTYGPSTKTISNHSYEQWNKRSSFQIEEAPAFIDFYSIDNKIGYVAITADGIIKQYKTLNQDQGISLTKQPLVGTIKRLTVSYDAAYYAATFQNSAFVYLGPLTGQSTPKPYDFSQYGQINNIRWNPKSLKLIVSAGKKVNSHRQINDQTVYLGQLDIQTDTFTDYSQIVQCRAVDLDYSADAETLYYLEQIKEGNGNLFEVFTFSFETKEKSSYIDSTFFTEWSQVVMIQLKDKFLLIKSSQRAKVCSSYSWGINCFDATDQFLGGTLSPNGLEWVNYGFIGGYSSRLQNIQITRYCGVSKYYSQTENTCRLCHQSCLTCISTSTFCSSCSDGLFLTPGNTCESCSIGCQFCIDGDRCSCKDSYYQATDLNCLLCSDAMPGCYTCDLQNKCKICHVSQQWELIDGQCKCIQRYFQNQGKCSKCPNYCLTCSAADKCIKCDPDAHTIADQDGICQCQQGYTFNGQVCQLCSQFVLGCLTCKNTEQCLSCDNENHFKISNDICICDDGFTLNDKSCKLCSYFILGCLTCNNKNQCLTCDQISHFDLKNRECICQEGYGLKDKSCELCSSSIPGCLTCTDLNTCTSCNEEDHFNLNKTKCSCSEGYGINGKQCQLCSSSIAGCLTCSDLQTCLICNQTSHFNINGSSCSCMQRYALSKDKACTLCSQLIGHCIFCSSSTICTTCEQPFILDSNSCSEKSEPNILLIAIGAGAGGIVLGIIIAWIVMRRKKDIKESLMTDTQAQSITIKDSLKIQRQD